jgi:hypothetical protein
MVDILIKIACFVKKKSTFSELKGGDLNKSVQGGQSYCPFPFSKDSLAQMYPVANHIKLFCVTYGKSDDTPLVITKVTTILSQLTTSKAL